MTETPILPATPEPAVGTRCENCGAQLLGGHCYSCGQPIKGLVRHFSSIVGDFFDSVFNFDTRTLRTLGPLLFKPGHLTNEYFHGHRVRYVSPVRLFFFLCIAAFFALQLTVDIDLDNGAGAQSSAIAKADTVAAVEKLRDKAVADLKKARAEIPDAPGARVGIEVAIAIIQDEAKERIAWIGKRDSARARGEDAPPYEGVTDDDKDGGDSGMRFNGELWDPVSNPLNVGWLPDAGNAALNRLVSRAKANIKRIQQQPRLLVDAFMEALPQTLFVLLPVFALLLKIFYVFKRRLYMEHLIVALHSHAFLCASILLLAGLSLLRDQTGGSGFLYVMLGWIEAAVALWMPSYLLLMQKRVYGQGWLMTLLKYGVLGTCYLVLISIGAGINLAVSLVAM